MHEPWPIMPLPFMGVHLCLAQQAASPAQLCNYRDHFTRLASHRSLPCLQCRRRERIVCALLQSPLSSLGNSSVQWPQTRCSSTFNQMFLPPPHVGLSWWDHAAVLGLSHLEHLKPSVINDSPAVKWFSFPSSKNGNV